ncbi:MAG TPA: ester cyclase, partial [Candidatus Limnocylindrales bacterium]|nr:ester cyclase [Candidatus Limnocylindrales bacterium]
MDNKTIRRLYHDAWNAGDTESLDSIMAPDVINHSPLPGQAAGVDGFKQALQWMRGGVPDLAITIASQIAEGDMVATRWTG